MLTCASTSHKSPRHTVVKLTLHAQINVVVNLDFVGDSKVAIISGTAVWNQLNKLQVCMKLTVLSFVQRDSTNVCEGGGAGHEPGQAGYVGEGMLAAAVSGHMFASPSAKSVLAAIRAIAGPAGCLLVVANYTGYQASSLVAATASDPAPLPDRHS